MTSVTNIRTIKQAQAEAIRRWGKNAAVSHRPKAACDKATREKWRTTKLTSDQIKALPKEEREERQAALLCYPFTVGVVMMGMFLEVKGQGDSWNEAFAEADRLANLEKERWAALTKK